MSNVDIEIYMTNLVKFFDKNPEQLKILIGENDSNVFFKKIRTVVESNEREQKELAPTRKQMMDVILEINQNLNPKKIDKQVSLFMEHHMGKIILN